MNLDTDEELPEPKPRNKRVDPNLYGRGFVESNRNARLAKRTIVRDDYIKTGKLPKRPKPAKKPKKKKKKVTV